MDFVLKNPNYGINSTEFSAAIQKGDAANIIEGIYSIIMLAETRFGIKLDEADKFRIQMAAQDEIVKQILDRAEKRPGTNSEKLKKFSEHISKTNLALSNAFANAVKSDYHGSVW